MPHLLLQYSANIDPPPELRRLFGELHRTIAELTAIEVASFKSRAIRCEEFQVGDGSPANAFAHLEVRLLGGRPAEQKRQVADAAIAILHAHFGPAERRLDLQITVDLLDLEADTYRKLASKGEPQ